ncbi:GntR family transcriptional regulator [Svornostia abyssi]|uniref:GntR family transcriptional regulator n=1 Tax=Svornostia abyssi TaxID=2898438 RepID=A0ABY5PB49_9ACTN|nr:GntR family transcriptional regulator [Parviterribacteraceae bacterium J379]
MDTAGRPTDARRHTEWAHRLLRDAILTGALAPGTPVSQLAVAKELGTSRTPVREAVRLLQHEGLVAGEVNQRLRVADLSAADLDELCAIRITLEVMGMRLAGAPISGSRATELRSYLDDLEKAAMDADPDRGRDLHRQFHLTLSGGGDDRLTTLVAETWDHAERYRRLFSLQAFSIERFQKAQIEHHEIVSRLEDGDLDAACDVLALHLATTALVVLADREPAFSAPAIRQALLMVGATSV